MFALYHSKMGKAIGCRTFSQNVGPGLDYHLVLGLYIGEWPYPRTFTLHLDLPNFIECDAFFFLVKICHFSTKKLGFLGISPVYISQFFVKISPNLRFKKKEEKTLIAYVPQGERLPMEQ